jgi:hypothetical protein
MNLSIQYRECLSEREIMLRVASAIGFVDLSSVRELVRARLNSIADPLLWG